MRSRIEAGPVVLRRYELAFAPLLFAAARETCSPVFTHFAPWCHAAYALTDSERFVAQSMRQWQDGTAYNFALFDAKSEEFCGGIGLNQARMQPKDVMKEALFCGGIGLNQANRVHGFYNLGYWVRSSRQRQGLATHAIRQLAQATFADLSTVHRLEILTTPDNDASQQAALAAGATCEGVLRQRLLFGTERQDAVLFSLVRGDVL